MNEDQETESKPALQKWAAEMLLPIIKACPHIIKKDTSLDMFVDELNKAAKKINEHPVEEMGSIKEFLPVISACPNLFKPEIGLELFAGELIKAVIKFNLYFH